MRNLQRIVEQGVAHTRFQPPRREFADLPEAHHQRSDRLVLTLLVEEDGVRAGAPRVQAEIAAA